MISRWNALRCLVWLTAAMMLIFARPSGAAAQTSSELLNKIAIEPQVGQTLPLDETFVNSDGESIPLRSVVSDRPVILCLVYFDCPMLCKLAADGLVRSVAGVPETAGEDFDIVLISFDPRDTPEKATAAKQQAMQTYAREGTEKGWHFLTGSQGSIDAVTSAVGFEYQWDETSQQFAHASGLIIVSPDGVITEYLDGVRFAPGELMAAVERASRGEKTDRELTAFARCYLYDPTTGKFGAIVQWTLRILCGLTVVAMGFGLYRFSSKSSTTSREQIS